MVRGQSPRVIMAARKDLSLTLTFGFYQPIMGFTRPLVVGYFTHHIA